MLRVALAGLFFLQPVVQAAELAPVDILLTRVIPQDEAALATAGPEKGAHLAKLQSDMALVVEGLEGFANEEDASPSLKRLRESIDAPEQFKDRASALDASYRALAVVDYTWAKRLPEAPCSPGASRAALLKSGPLSSWISSLLGVDADTAAALDRASAATKASVREYALLRAKVRRLSEALGSDKAIGVMRASLYCRRAEAYEALSAANRSSGLVAAARSTGADDVTGVYVLARTSADGLEILGAATSIDGAIVTDARLVDSEGLVLLHRDEKKPIPVRVERSDSGLALLRASEPVKGITLAETAPAKDDLIEALGHPERTGAWTRTRGLVTSADALSFQSDAVVDVGMTGGAALTEDGKLAGVFVLRRAQAGDEAFDWPVAVNAPALKSWLAGGPLASPAGSIEIAEAGTASILTASRPLGEKLSPGAQATQAGYSFYQDGHRAVCVANCGDAAPAPRARSYSRPSSSYGSNANAELGEALGELAFIGAEALIFKGIPALFRGIGSLFSKKGKASALPSRQAAVQAPVKVPEKPKEPPTLTALTLEVTPKSAAPGESVTLTASATLSDPQASKANISVAFKASPATLVRFDGAPQAKTNPSGVATISATVRRDHGVRAVKSGDSK
ncbi:MAG: serine protease, partial [Elusimicrobiota bacterium]